MRPVSSIWVIQVRQILRQDYNFLHGCRVGEASNPGPWTLQLRNVVSAAKAIQTFSFTADCHVWTETSATAITQERIAKQIRTARGHVVSSFPAPKANPTAVGKPEAMGSLIIARQPARDLGLQWESAIYRTARIADTILQLGHCQIRVIAVYGYHSGTADSLSKNEFLLQQVFHMAGQFHMPTLITGDFNCDFQSLPVWEHAVARGFQDLALKQATLRMTSPDNTYRDTSRLDYIIANPLASRAFSFLEVDPQGFRDHAIVTAHFDWNIPLTTVNHWSMPSEVSQYEKFVDMLKNNPQSLGTPTIPSCSGTENKLPTPTDALLLSFVTLFEKRLQSSHVVAYGKPLPSRFLGRCSGQLQTLPRSQVYVCQHTGQATDRHILALRLKSLNWVKEILHGFHLPHKSAHNVILWDKVCRSQGFKPSFQLWVLQQDVVSYFPLQWPSFEWFQLLHNGLCQEAKQWHQLVQKQQNKSWKAVMLHDWATGGKIHASMVKPVPLGTLDSLMHEQRIAGRLLRVSKAQPAQLKLERDCTGLVGATLHAGKKCWQICKVHRNFVELDKPASVELLQKAFLVRNWCTKTKSVASQVQAYWNTFWNTDREPDVAIMHELIAALPQVPEFSPNIGRQELDSAISALPLGKARGMDGFSNGELRLLSDVERDALCALFNTVTETGQWPQPLLQAFVVLLAKTTQPQTPKDARPITILPTLYRLYAKIQAKKVFQAILPWIPGDLYGSVPGRSSMDAAYELQSLLEEAMGLNQGLVGVSLDLSKAYNTIPRSFLRLLAARCGWPSQLIRCYDSFLAGLVRSFKLHDGLHAPTLSTVGVPEGCPLAVPTMIMLTWAVTVAAQKQGGRLLSYVDNWTSITKDVATAMPVLNRIKWATDGLALLLNPEKTRAFATAPHMRAQLRMQNLAGCALQVCNNIQDLGVSFTASLHPTAATLQQRFEKNDIKLQRLQSMRWPVHRKFQVFQRVIWPSVSYGGELASTSPTFLAKLRSRFSAVLWGQFQHRDHFLGPLFAGDFVYEPFLLILAQRLRALRRAFLHHAECVYQRWNTALHHPHATGPLRYLQDMLALIGWSFLPNLMVTDGSRSWHLGHVDIETLHEVTFKAWFSVVATKIQHKQGMEHIKDIDPCFSLLLRKISKQSPSSLGNFTAGAALSSKNKRHFLSETDSKCRLCGREDSQRHRLLYCPGTEIARANLDLAPLQEAPTLLLERLLSGKPTAIQAWDDYVANLCPQDYPVCFTEFVHLFTDGSTYGNHDIARSTWAVVLADPDRLDTVVCEAGQLPGRQCNFRAELYAVAVAVQLADAGAALYVDCKGVVQGLQRLLSQGWDRSFWCKQKNVSLWHYLWTKLAPKRMMRWEVQHIRSHRDFRIQPSDLQAWTAFCNQKADDAAKRIQFLQDVPGELYKAAQAAFQSAAYVARQVATLQVSVLEVAASCKKPHSMPVPQPADASQPVTLALNYNIAWPSPQIFEDTLLCPGFLYKLQEFFPTKEWFQSTACFSMAELYFAFVWATNWVVPVNIGAWPVHSQPEQFRSTAPSAWVHESEYESLSLHRPSFTKQLTIFMHTLKFVFQRLQLPWTLVRGKHLAWMQCSQDVLGLSAVPSDVINLRKQFLHYLKGSTFQAFAKLRFHPPSPPTPLTLPVSHPQTRWNRYFASRRTRQA